MRTQSLFMVLVAGAFLAACDSRASDDALVGSWIRMRDTGEMRDRYVFGADGSFRFDENKPDDPQTEDHIIGTYVAADGVAAATVTNTLAPGQWRMTFSYYANAGQFSSSAMRPRSAHTGIVGVWRVIRHLQLVDGSGPSPTGEEVEGEYRADGTFRWTITPFDGTAATTTEGTWVAEAGGTFRQTSDGSEKVLKLLDDEALVFPSAIWQRK